MLHNGLGKPSKTTTVYNLEICTHTDKLVKLVNSTYFKYEKGQNQEVRMAVTVIDIEIDFDTHSTLENRVKVIQSHISDDTLLLELGKGGNDAALSSLFTTCN